MKILLQNTQSKLYFCLLDLWTANPQVAYNFRRSQQALEFVRNQNLRDVQLVVKFEDPQWDEIIPMPMVVATLGQQMAA